MEIETMVFIKGRVLCPHCGQFSNIEASPGATGDFGDNFVSILSSLIKQCEAVCKVLPFSEYTTVANLFKGTTIEDIIYRRQGWTEPQ